MNHPPPPPASAGSPRRVLWLALAAGAVLAAADGVAAAHGAGTLRGYVAVLEIALAGAACLAAALVFGRGDHLRRAWALMSLSHLALALLYAGDLVGLPASAMPTWFLGTFTLLTNVLRAAGTAVFAFAWLRTGLPAIGTRRGNLAAGMALLAVSLAVVGPDLMHYARAALRGDAYGGILALADVSDLLVLLMVAPLVRIARALAGGSLAWPFGLMAAASVCWLVFDGVGIYAEALGASALEIKYILGALQALGCTLFAAAAVTQRRAIRAAARGAARA
jgi:hypothetical protein